MKQPSSKIYNSLRYDDTMAIVTFHLREKDWNQLKSRGLMWFSAVAASSAAKFPLEVVECHQIFLGDERVKNRGRVDPVQTFGLFSVQSFDIEESNDGNGPSLNVHVKHFLFLRFIPREMQRVRIRESVGGQINFCILTKQKATSVITNKGSDFSTFTQSAKFWRAF